MGQGAHGCPLGVPRRHPDEYRQSYRATANASEGIAAAFCDLTLCLDELRQSDAAEVVALIFMLFAGQGKLRMSRAGTPRERLTWSILALSNGEITLAQHVASVGKTVDAGVLTRVAEIRAALGPWGAFEELHGHASSSDFAKALEAASKSHYGAVGAAWLQWCVDHARELPKLLIPRVGELVKELVPPEASGQVHRVAQRFALVGLAGEMATTAGLTGWPEGVARNAAIACFRDWLADRPAGIGLSEDAAIMSQIRLWFENNGAGRFTTWHRATDDHAPDKSLRAGFKKFIGPNGSDINSDIDWQAVYGDKRKMSSSESQDTIVEYYVFPETFNKEICRGVDPQRVKALLLSKGLLLPAHGEKYTCKPRLPGLGPTRCFRIPAAIHEGD